MNRSETCLVPEKCCRLGREIPQNLPGSDFWCRKSIFLAPEFEAEQVWCRKRGILAPEFARSDFWCRKSIFLAPDGEPSYAGKEGGSKGGNSRLAQVRKPEFTLVNEDFRGKHNAEFTLLGCPQKKNSRGKAGVIHFLKYVITQLSLIAGQNQHLKNSSRQIRLYKLFRLQGISL